jgi:hypothetical protein
MRIIRSVMLLLALGLIATVAHAQQLMPLKGFSVVLLMGEAQGTVPTQGLSPSAQKALGDIREFLPYKGYRVLDTQWVAGSEFGTSKGQLRSDQKNYEFSLETVARDSSPIRARFMLLTPPKGYTSTGAKLGVTTVLDNSFAIKAGETVVVGTSRVQADSALIVLLTAVASK